MFKLTRARYLGVSDFDSCNMDKSLLFCIDVNRIISPLVYDCKVKTECDIVNFFESFLISTMDLWIFDSKDRWMELILIRRSNLEQLNESKSLHFGGCNSLKIWCLYLALIYMYHSTGNRIISNQNRMKSNLRLKTKA